MKMILLYLLCRIVCMFVVMLDPINCRVAFGFLVYSSSTGIMSTSKLRSLSDCKYNSAISKSYCPMTPIPCLCACIMIWKDSVSDFPQTSAKHRATNSRLLYGSFHRRSKKAGNLVPDSARSGVVFESDLVFSLVTGSSMTVLKRWVDDVTPTTDTIILVHQFDFDESDELNKMHIFGSTSFHS